MRRADIIVLAVIPMIAATVALVLRINYLTAVVLFFGPLAVWLSYRTPKATLKSGIFSIIFSIPLVIIVEHFALLDSAWLVPDTVFPFRLLRNIPVEDLILGLLLVYTIILYYEHFLDKGKSELIDRRMKYFIWPIIILLVSLLSFAYISPTMLSIPYAYLWMGMVFGVIPVVVCLTLFPRLLAKYIKTTLYFFFLLLLFEFVGLELGHWIFPAHGHVIGWIEVGKFRFPLEELIIWMGVSSVAVLSYFEYFDDDRE